MMAALLWFAASGAIIVLGGAMLTRAADVIADRTGLGRVFVGTLLLATATSLPELTTDIAAVRLGEPNLAAGDLFGSSMANMLILALINLLPPRGQVFRRAASAHVLAGVLAIGLNALAAVFVLARPPYVILGISPGSVLIVVVFLAGMRTVYNHSVGAGSPADSGTAPAGPHALSLNAAGLRFIVATVLIFVVAPRFAGAAKQVADLSGLGATFVGTWLVGAATSAPELVSCIAAVRLGAFDLAVGNLLGSNSFNMVVFLAMDVAHPGRTIFGAIDPSHALSALVAVVLMCLALVAIVYRAERRFAFLESDSWVMLLTYLAGLWLLYQRTGAH